MIGLAALPVVLTAAGAVMAGWGALTSARARHDLSKSVRASAADVRDVKLQLDANNIEAATAIVRKHIGTLSAAEQRAADSALGQPSPAGRASYIRGVAGQS